MRGGEQICEVEGRGGGERGERGAVVAYIREYFDEPSSESQVPVFLEEGRCLSLVPYPSGTSDAMDIFLNVVG